MKSSIVDGVPSFRCCAGVDNSSERCLEKLLRAPEGLGDPLPPVSGDRGCIGSGESCRENVAGRLPEGDPWSEGGPLPSKAVRMPKSASRFLGLPSLEWVFGGLAGGGILTAPLNWLARAALAALPGDGERLGQLGNSRLEPVLPQRPVKGLASVLPPSAASMVPTAFPPGPAQE